MKIADAVISLMKKECRDKKWDENNWSIVPFDRHDFCFDVLIIVGKTPHAKREGLGGYESRYKDCKSIADALERDRRFRKTLVPHQVLRRMFDYLGEVEDEEVVN